MADPNPDVPEPTSLILRNPRFSALPDRALTTFAYGAGLLSVVSYCLGIYQVIFVPVTLAVCGYFLVRIVVVYFSPWSLGVHTLVISERALQRVPGGYYRSCYLQSVSLLPDPHEDFADNDTPEPLCMARIQPRWWKSFEMPLSAADAARLVTWATAHQLAVYDCREKRRG